jgi:pimeloyl-ACP methyl ester carboxylesterase
MPPEFWEGMKNASPESMPAVLRDAYLAASPSPDLARFVDKTRAMMLGARDLRDDELRAIAAPALVMVGDADVILPEHAVELFRLLPHALLAVFPGTAHGAYLGAAESTQPGDPPPEIASGMIERFLAAT